MGMVKKFSGGFGPILAQISLFSPYFANIWVIQLKKILAARLLNYGRLFFFKKNFTMLAYSDWSLIRNVIVHAQFLVPLFVIRKCVIFTPVHKPCIMAINILPLMFFARAVATRLTSPKSLGNPLRSTACCLDAKY